MKFTDLFVHYNVQPGSGHTANGRPVSRGDVLHFDPRMHAQHSDTALNKFAGILYDLYDSYKIKEITSRRLKHDAMMNILRSLQASMKDILAIEQIGASSEGRSINLLTLGSGKRKIFMWSQMHGDEPTATMGILDMLSYIAGHRSSAEVNDILSKTTLLIIPMLNPDGAQRFQRRSVHWIDINRDALQLRTVEAQLLKQTRDRYSPEFGFNLHDQEPRYTVGTSGNVATIALLAPSIDKAKSENAVRLRAKKVASRLADIFSPFIDGHISRYDDSFEPRAFGDNIQKWGTSTVLVESGGAKNDPEKMSIRKLNCVALLSICHSIATGEYEAADIARYEGLPENTKNLFDIIVRGVTLVVGNGVAPVVVDLGINVEDMLQADGSVVRKGKIADIGDLSMFSSFDVVDGKGKSIDAQMAKLESIVDVQGLIASLRKQGG